MAEVKPSATENVAIETVSAADLAWAQDGLRFELGKSGWPERVRAIAEHLGGFDDAVATSGIKLGTFRSWQTRGSKPRDLFEVAGKLGVSPEYLDDGAPLIPADFDVELARLALAQKDFVAAGSTRLRREARKLVIERWRSTIETARAAALTRGPAPAGAGLDDAADAYFAPGMLEAHHGLAGISQSNRSPVAFSRDWLVRHRLDAESLAVLELRADDLFLVDTSPAGRQLIDGCLYAVIAEGAFSIWQCKRGRDGELALTYVPNRPVGLGAPVPPGYIVAGRLVYELAAL